MGTKNAAELAELLVDLGLEAKPARVVAHLALEGQARSTDLETACGLRQPEVSQATKKLRDEYQWVEASPIKSRGKGRPVNEYALQIPFASIVEDLERRKRAQIDDDLRRLELLREVASALGK